MIARFRADQSPARVQAELDTINSRYRAQFGSYVDATKYDHPVTMLYVDGDQLTLIHYCDAGNRPRMIGKMSPDGKTVEFEFKDISGGMDHHMHHSVFTILDANPDNLETASRFLDDKVRTVHAWYEPNHAAGFDLVVFPLAFRGERAELYRQPPAPLVAVHDWAWRQRGNGVLVSLFLLKRLNLVRS